MTVSPFLRMKVIFHCEWGLTKKAYQTQSQKVGVLSNWHTCPGKGANADKETKRQRPGLTLSKGHPNLECAHRDKTIL